MNVGIWIGIAIAVFAALLLALTWSASRNEAGQAMPVGGIAMFFEQVLLGIGLLIVGISAAIAYAGPANDIDWQQFKCEAAHAAQKAANTTDRKLPYVAQVLAQDAEILREIEADERAGRISGKDAAQERMWEREAVRAELSGLLMTPNA